MKRKRIVLIALAFMLVFGMGLAGCGSEDEGTTTEEGFAADATIGVSLPWLGTQNWKEAETMYKDQLEAAGFKAIVQQADNKADNQLSQIEAMIEQDCKVIVVAPVDAALLGTVLEKAKDAGIYIIAYDRLIENTKAIDGVVQYGSIKTGELQGQALLDGLATRGDPPYNIELFAGGPADPNAVNFFDGAMTVLQPKIDDGTLVVVSDQTDFATVATADWENPKAQARMDTLLAGFYSNKKIDGALAPNDGIARAIITACKQAGQKLPITSGLDAENESISWIWEGKQYCTIDKPTAPLVEKTIEIVQSLQEGKGMPEATATADNGKIKVNLYELEPTVVTKDNIKEVFANDPGRMKLLKD